MQFWILILPYHGTEALGCTEVGFPSINSQVICFILNADVMIAAINGDAKESDKIGMMLSLAVRYKYPAARIAFGQRPSKTVEGRVEY